ncbi:MAG TPA: bifunctional hydroxymethylpyrimidine kinase/phosphomethylpyrimidine kinase, partial [Pyrinomonadaceae bacterium]
ASEMSSPRHNPMDQEGKTAPVVLTIAGLDPSGGAGILADARTIIAFKCRATAAISAITFQNAAGVKGFVVQSRETLRAQLEPIFSELPVAAVKTGMLPTLEIVREVIRAVREHPVRFLVIDPVKDSTSGYELMDAKAAIELRENLLPLASLVTPNIPEAESLVGFSIRNEMNMRRAAEKIRNGGVKAVLIKGGHLETQNEVIDLLDDGGRITVFRSERVGGGEFRGTGCSLASGIAACLALGESLETAVQSSRDFVLRAMREANT